jgi:hypothetical protein
VLALVHTTAAPAAPLRDTRPCPRVLLTPTLVLRWCYPPRNYALENAMEAANLPLVELLDR